MRLEPEQFFHLTYCTNIHPSHGWDDVQASLRRYAPPLKARFSPDAPFGIGLRLSGVESRELLEGDRLQRFRGFLEDEGLYVAIINGFPYGPFHHQPVKEYVHAPDWRDPERVAYTLRLVEILTALLPPGMEGGISTSPLSYVTWVNASDEAMWDLLVRHLVQVAAAMVRVSQEQGKLIHLDIEPEPDGLLGDFASLAGFYEQRLLPQGAPMLAEELGIPETEARGCLLEHLRVCLDACHIAVGYEDPAAILDRYANLGIRVGRVQVSSALKVRLPDDAVAREETARALERFADATYLHQVIQRNRDGSFVSYLDLPDALPHIGDPEAAEWRIHFHVPVFVEGYESFGSTQEDLLAVLALARERRLTPYLEIETYTWDVLPRDMKAELGESIAREIEWVLRAF